MELDERMIRQAIAEAEKALDAGDVPVGAVIVHNDRIIGRGHNQRELLQDPTAHAEMIALTAAAAELGTWRFTDCTIYVTLEPCPMCAGALVQARINRLVFGADDPKAGACGSMYNIVEDDRLNHLVKVDRGIMGDECAQLLKDFFAAQRAMGKK
jgi:tRNA(adenine34) deaminase